MESKFSLSFSHSPNPDMPNVRMNLEDEFSQDEPKQSDNMSVYARIRPMLQREEDAGYKECVGAIDDETVRAVFPKSSAKFKNTSTLNEIIEDFKYTRAFGPETGQFLFFEETIMKTMQSFIGGQNCLIFSYGITNSGKTYTLQGTEENPGIIILALRLFFSSIEHQLLDNIYVKPDKFSDLTILNDTDKAKEIAIRDDLMKFYNQEVNKSVEASTSRTKSFAMKLCDCFSDSYKLGDIETTLPPAEMESAQSAAVMKMLSKQTADQQIGKCNIWISFIEIYNEYIYDLLQPNVFPRKKLQLAEDQNGDVFVKGAREIYVSNVDEALKLLHIGRKSLRIACTKLNYQSSRSHCIYILKVVRLGDDFSSFRVNRLSFCDLAGSERASKSETSGTRLKEACYINSSLLVLGRCLEQLRLNQNSKEKKQIIPFRDSKLTRLFSGHFVGKGNAVMIANASPCEYTFDETLNVLKFSAVAKELILNDTYLKNASSSLQSISNQWTQSRAQVSSFSLDQSSDLENSLFEDIQAKDEMIEKLLDLADSLRKNLEQEKTEKANLEYTIRQEVYRDYATYSDELLEKQKERYESQMDDLRDHYNQRLEALEKRKDDIIKDLREQIAEYEASEDESFQSINASFSSSIKYGKKETPSKAEVSIKDGKQHDTNIPCYANGDVPSHIDILSKDSEQYQEENRILKLDLCSIKNQLEISSLELQKSSEEIARLQNEITEYKNKADLENISDWKCDHIPEIERLTADLISLKEDLNLVTTERDSTKEELEQMSMLLQESETNKTAAEDKCLHLSTKLQESLNVLEQFEKEVAVLKSEMSIAEAKIAELDDEKQKMKETVFSLSEELSSSTELIEKLKNEKLDFECSLTTLEENLKAAYEKNNNLEKKLEETTNALNEMKSNILNLESERETFKSESTSLSARCKSVEEEISSSNELIEKLKKEKSDVMNCLAISEETLKGANEKHGDLNGKLEEATQLLQEQTAKIFALESEREAYKNESANLFAKCKSLEEETTSISQNLEKLKSEKEATKRISDEIINSLKSDLSDSENQFSEIKRKLEEADSVIENKEIEFSQLKEEYASVQQKLLLLESKPSSLEKIHGEEYDLELSVLKQKLSDAHKMLEEQEALCSTLKLDNTKLSEDNKQLMSELDVKTEHSFDGEAEISFGTEDPNELDTYKMRLSEREKECEILNNKYNNVLNNRHELEEEIATLNKKLEAAANDVERIEKEKVAVEETLNMDFQNASTSLKQKEIELESLQKEHAFCKEEISELKKEKSCLEDKATDLLNQLDAVKTELSDLERKHFDTISNLQSLDSTLKNVQKGLEKSEEEKKLMEENYSALVAKNNDESVLKDEVERLNLKIRETSSKVIELQDQNSSLTAELASKEEQTLKLNETIKTLEEKISSLSEQSALAKEELTQMKKENQENLEANEAIRTLEHKNREIEVLKNECTHYKEEIIQLAQKSNEQKVQTSDLITKLDAANEELSDLKNKLLEATRSLETMKSELSNLKTVQEEKKRLEGKYSALIENNDVANEELSNLKNKLLETTSDLKTMESKFSELQTISKEKKLLEEKYLALVENKDLIADEMSNLKKENDEKEKSLEEFAELIKILELNELRASEKIKSLEGNLSQHLNIISDMERQIREKELAISELEKALDESQKRVKEINAENQKLGKAKKKTSANKPKHECDNKENADKFESSKDKQLKRNSSTTSEEGEKIQEPKKTRRALRARQADSITNAANESDDDEEKPIIVSRKRKSDEEFLPSKRQKEGSKIRKIPSRRGLKDKKEENLKKVQNENMSPVQKVAAFVGSTLRSVANTVSNMPSPRMTRGRRKLFNVDSAATPTKTWKY